MSRLGSLIYLLPNLWQTLITRPITVQYPFGALSLPHYFRGRVVIDADLCQGCGSCVRDCPALALILERENREAFRLTYYADRCGYCGQCETSCRFGAISLINEFVGATSQRQALAWVMVERNTDASTG
jgi:formate hydrogenlyase subunit 6/NADH:ubiquinone oxidoreductase subunit I